MSHLIAERSIPNIKKPKNYPPWFRLSTIRKVWSFHVVVPQRTAMKGNETKTVEYSTELAFNSNLPSLIVLNVAFYINLHFSGPSIWNNLDEELKSRSLHSFKQTMKKRYVSTYG